MRNWYIDRTESLKAFHMYTQCSEDDRVSNQSGLAPESSGPRMGARGVVRDILDNFNEDMYDLYQLL
jgi:hypothetical protein